VHGAKHQGSLHGLYVPQHGVHLPALADTRRHERDPCTFQITRLWKGCNRRQCLAPNRTIFFKLDADGSDCTSS
jgi:hypothetical protein